MDGARRKAFAKNNSRITVLLEEQKKFGMNGPTWWPKIVFLQEEQYQQDGDLACAGHLAKIKDGESSNGYHGLDNETGEDR
jgi:hypothetical protein